MITYQSSDTSVATIAANTGEVTIVGIGTTTITATKAVDTNYYEATTSYSLTIDSANAFVTTWEVTADSLGITIPTNPNPTFAYNYTVDWGDSSADTTTHTGDASHTYAAAGSYTVSIVGTFPSIYFADPSPTFSDNIFDLNADPNADPIVIDGCKIKTIKQWGNNPWKSMKSAFRGCENLTIEAAAGNPVLSTVTDMSYMFYEATAFNQDLSGWDVSNVTDMNRMFRSATAFNQDLSKWKVGNVTNMFSMFYSATAFNQDLSGWEVGNVTDMTGMFRFATAFNQELSGWDVSKVTEMHLMFHGATDFNQDLSGWNVSNVTSMSSMFENATDFDQDLSGWNVSNVDTMSSMFKNATDFDQDLSGWNVSNVEIARFMFENATLSTANYEALLKGWSALPTLQNGVPFHGGNSKYCLGAAAEARNKLTSMYNWNITDGGQDLDENCLIDQKVFAFASATLTKGIGDAAFTFTLTDVGSGTGVITYHSSDISVATIDANGEVTITGGGETTITATKAKDTTYFAATASYALTITIDYRNAFVTTWEVEAGSLGITIPTIRRFAYSYVVEWGDESKDLKIHKGDATHTYAAAGSYTVSIVGTFPGIYFNAPTKSHADERKIKTIKQWGDNPWKSMNRAFRGCENLTIEATAGNPDLSNVTDMAWMFNSADAFNQNISGWDVRNVTDMSSMFSGATAFNQDLNGWGDKTSNVTDMSSMFSGATAFNQDLSGWDVSNVTSMGGMFYEAAAFNQDLSGWDVSKVTDMHQMFYGATAFNQALNGWGNKTSNVKDMSEMFSGATAFNQVLSGWNVRNVKDMWAMFSDATNFNQGLSGWEVGNVRNMASMFNGAVSFNRSFNLGASGGWDVSNVENMTNMFNGVTLSRANYDALLGGWSALPALQRDVPFHGGNSKYCNVIAIDTLVITYNWDITDGGNDGENCPRKTGTGTAIGLTLTPPTLTLNEGATTTYTAILDTRPTDTVTVGITTSDNSVLTFTPATLTFTPTNWNSAQSVTITAETDTNRDDNSATLTHTGSNSSTAELSITVTDTDTPPMFADGTAIDSTYPAKTRITPLIFPEASGGVGTLTYALTPKISIPAGLTFDATTRTLSGTTPNESVSRATLIYTVTDNGDPVKTDTLTFSVTVVMVTVAGGGGVAYSSSGAIEVTNVGADDNNDMRLMLPAGHNVDEVTVNLGTYTPTPSTPLPNGATYSGVGVDIELRAPGGEHDPGE